MFRRTMRLHLAVIATALAVSLSAGIVALPHSDGLDDAACSPVAVAHDTNSHYVGPAAGARTSDTEHCYLCHSLRTFHAPISGFTHEYVAPRAEHLHAASPDAVRAVAWTLAPGRAPPA